MNTAENVICHSIAQVFFYNIRRVLLLLLISCQTESRDCFKPRIVWYVIPRKTAN